LFAVAARERGLLTTRAGTAPILHETEQPVQSLQRDGRSEYNPINRNVKRTCEPYHVKVVLFSSWPGFSRPFRFMRQGVRA
jgi:hypothetical protein